jgi:hypothetical protein
VYLTRRNCMLELIWAVEEHRASSKPLIIVSVDPELTMNAIGKWDVSQHVKAKTFDNKDQPVDIVIDRQTAAFVREHIPGVNFFEQWNNGEGSWSPARETAVDKMLDSLKLAIANPLPTQAPLRMEVKKDGGRWFIECAGA